jgi:hydrogenase nickel incorporation protein HypA/HybF
MPEALTFAFNALTTGTPAEGATLVWDEIPPRVRCSACQAIFEPEDDMLWICPSCGAAGGELLEGNELVLQSVVFKDGGC